MTRRSRKNASDKSDAHKDPEGREDLERILTSIPVDRMLRFFFFFFLEFLALARFCPDEHTGREKIRKDDSREREAYDKEVEPCTTGESSLDRSEYQGRY